MNDLEREIERFNDCLTDFLTALDTVLEQFDKNITSLHQRVQELQV